MVRKCLCDGNDVTNDNGDDNVKISFYKILKGIVYIEVTKVQEGLKEAFCYKLQCRKLLLVAHASVRISDGIDCHIHNYLWK